MLSLQQGGGSLSHNAGWMMHHHLGELVAQSVFFLSQFCHVAKLAIIHKKI